ncbi:Exocyst complex component exo84 [Smittium mucronatum]|uniref:Exocyst complex component exo84 n=1 Tax=Smittium mucronatum TaxID=133383 RepID=A0A1R0GXF4_9FUNG|nr:Exocyst complex component exo84 [Smittium mucronatum]
MDSLHPTTRLTPGIEKVNIGAPKLIAEKFKVEKNEDDEPVVILNKFMKPDFVAEKYLMDTLEFVTEPNIRQFRKSLEGIKKVATQSLQKNVYKDYKDFVVITKEISIVSYDSLLYLLHNCLQLA